MVATLSISITATLALLVSIDIDATMSLPSRLISIRVQSPLRSQPSADASKPSTFVIPRHASTSQYMAILDRCSVASTPSHSPLTFPLTTLCVLRAACQNHHILFVHRTLLRNQLGRHPHYNASFLTPRERELVSPSTRFNLCLPLHIPDLGGTPRAVDGTGVEGSGGGMVEEAEVFRSLVATVNVKPVLDESMEAKALNLLNSVDPDDFSAHNKRYPAEMEHIKWRGATDMEDSTYSKVNNPLHNTQFTKLSRIKFWFHQKAIFGTCANTTSRSSLETCRRASQTSPSPILTAMRSEFHSHIPEHVLRLLSPKDLEQIVCGKVEIDVEDWKKHTSYTDALKSQPRVIFTFWTMVKNADESMRRAIFCLRIGLTYAPPTDFKNLEAPQRTNRVDLDFISWESPY
ncbi:hypothetical protein BLNAU_18216 [Blattamonas nauphoetae]|uniref:HECT-type E3 ubiquitin transferase n=1 Tax=Blattamonas nauphoetae TaxID=2049346 RepID=A0ABQ9X4Y7_9EUKA|nr:hypothetical protein BLNAU_18216 [Blattamonas nauphoetae]